jgi:penicillin-binding protein-related factor A (putative recombinase)
MSVYKRKREADFSVTVRHWLKANPFKFTCAFEMKQTTTNSIPFDCVEQHQIEYGEAIKNSPKGVLMRVQGSNGEPDYLYLYRDPVYIVIKYPSVFCFISLDAFLAEKTSSKRKSLTADRARDIAIETVDL